MIRGRYTGNRIETDQNEEAIDLTRSGRFLEGKKTSEGDR